MKLGPAIDERGRSTLSVVAREEHVFKVPDATGLGEEEVGEVILSSLAGRENTVPLNDSPAFEDRERLLLEEFLTPDATEAGRLYFNPGYMGKVLCRDGSHGSFSTSSRPVPWIQEVARLA